MKSDLLLHKIEELAEIVIHFRKKKEIVGDLKIAEKNEED